MERVKDVIRLGVWTALLALLVAAVRVVWVIPEVYDHHSRENRAALTAWGDNQANATRKDVLRLVDSRLESIERNAVREIRAVRRDVKEIVGTTDNRAAEIQKDAREEIRDLRASVDGRLVEIGTSLSEEGAVIDSRLGELTTGLEATQVPIRRMVTLFNQQFMEPVAVDGRGNITAYSRFLALSGEAMKTSDNFRRITEAMADNTPAQQAAVTGIAKDVHTFTSSFVRPKRWYVIVLDHLERAAFGWLIHK